MKTREVRAIYIFGKKKKLKKRAQKFLKISEVLVTLKLWTIPGRSSNPAITNDPDYVRGRGSGSGYGCGHANGPVHIHGLGPVSRLSPDHVPYHGPGNVSETVIGRKRNDASLEFQQFGSIFLRIERINLV